MNIIKRILKIFTVKDILDTVDTSVKTIQDCNKCKINIYKELKEEVEKEKCLYLY